jgi:hypothetical protein
VYRLASPTLSVVSIIGQTYSQDHQGVFLGGFLFVSMVLNEMVTLTDSPRKKALNNLQ